MNIFIFLLIVIPLLFALLYTISSKKIYYKILSGIFCIISSTLAIILAANGPKRVIISGLMYQGVENFIKISEILIIIYLFKVSVKNRRWDVFSLTVLSTILSAYIMIFGARGNQASLNIDKLSIVMALIVNVIGTLIVMFANEYIVEYEKERGLKNRQKFFYPVICIFLSAMNGLIFSDSMSWIYFFWEITTVASFLLISYNNDKEAISSGFRALFLNLIGGICFLSGIILFEKFMGIESLSQILQNGRVHSWQIIPVFLLCIAAFAKSAQMPFQSWLIGAMVAPTPVSALLHSSTMVNAGVYLVVKLSPAYAGTVLGTSIAMYGGFTFLICSAIAITQKNAKKVLAYSTIANLGLVMSSAGMGTSTAISAAIMLIIFHAVSKALLFLCTGEIEEVIGSRNLEDMSGLIRKAPLLTMMLCLGILSMILPPFGVLITKWISIEASATNPFAAIFLILGSAFTTAFWIKWLGTVLSYPNSDLKQRCKMKFTTYFPLGVLSILILFTSIFMTKIFNIFVSPEVSGLLKSNNQLSSASGNISSKVGSFNDSVVFAVLLMLIVAYLLIRKFILTPTIKKVYLCGENDAGEGSAFKFRSGSGTVERAVVSNLYLYHIIDEKKLSVFGCIVSTAMIAITFLEGLL